MTERGRLCLLLVSLAVLAGVLSWPVLGASGDGVTAASRCVWAVTINDGFGYQQAPCHQKAKDLLEDLDLLVEDLNDRLYCDPGLHVAAPNDDLGQCPPRSTQSMKRSADGPVSGTVARWNDQEGWGVLVSPSVLGKVWAHFSMIEMDGYRTLNPGQEVTFTYETPGQDGYPHRALSVGPQ
jgi:CspA family cold shock protein